MDENSVIFCCAMVISRKKFRQMGRKQSRLAAWQGKWDQEIKVETQSAKAAKAKVPPIEPEQEKQDPQGGNQVQMIVQVFRQVHTVITQDQGQAWKVSQ